MGPKDVINDLLNIAGIELNGRHPWDIQVYNDKVYQRVLANGSVGLGESYMDGWWDAQALDQFLCKMLAADLENKVKPTLKSVFYFLQAKLLNLQTENQSVQLKHYETGNSLFQKMLDKRMAYSCGYWANAKTLDEAQEAKLDLICRKIYLKPGMRVLDIGCGWGSFMKFAAEKYGVECVGVSISNEQTELGRKLCQGLPIEFRVQDYRKLNEKFDRIVSVGMFEHVGFKNYDTFMDVAANCLTDDGLFLLHTIGWKITGTVMEPWINKYIFPNAFLPSAKHITSAAEGKFLIEDWHNFGADYDKTIMAWFENFNNHWNELKPEYDERFYKMWKYYLMASAATFRARAAQLWQIVLSKTSAPNGYRSVR